MMRKGFHWQVAIRCRVVVLTLCLLYSGTATAADFKDRLSPELKDSIETAVYRLGSMLLEQSIGPDKVFPVLRRFLDDHPQVYGSAMAYAPHKADDITTMSCPYVYRQNQTLIEKNLAKKDYNYTHWAWYTRPRDTRKAMWSEPYFDKGGGEVMMTTFSLPLFQKHADGEFVGVVTADVILQLMP